VVINVPGLGEVEVEATWLRPYRAGREWGQPVEPDDGGYWEIDWVKVDGEEIELTEEQIEAIDKALEDEHAR
jgi:hypothetical protein